MSRRVVAILLAAGRGRRAGLGRNKAFHRRAGRTVLGCAFESLAAVPGLEGVAVVHAAGEAAAVRRGLPPGACPTALVEGGAERHLSVLNGLRFWKGRADPDGVVLVHDAARPFLPRRVAEGLLAAVGRRRGAVPGLPVADTLKRVERGRVVATVDRGGLVAVQTPQAFLFGELLAAYEAWSGGVPTDDAQVFESWGGRVAVVPGSPWLMKVTWPEDVALFDLMVDADVPGRLRR